ncbi:MAG TPA: hypothetical protein VGP60_28090 [Amycolatopsis sp.]|nr:hypothetical protein [Amycolatopsis sp.]
MADELALRDVVAHTDREVEEMGVVGVVASTAVLDLHQPPEPVAFLVGGNFHGTGRGRQHRLAEVVVTAAPVEVELPVGSVRAAPRVVAGPRFPAGERELENGFRCLRGCRQDDDRRHSRERGDAQPQPCRSLLHRKLSSIQVNRKLFSACFEPDVNNSEPPRRK